MRSFINRAGTGAMVTVAAISLAACGSSHPATTPAPTKTAPPPAASPTGPAAADAATTTAVAKAYATFFDGNSHPAQAAAALQNAPQLAAVLAQAAKNPTAAGLSAKVSKVTLENAHVANVTFSLFSKGFAVLTNTSGKAVLVSGHWQVAAATFCGLEAASNAGKVPAGCTAALMALPTS